MAVQPEGEVRTPTDQRSRGRHRHREPRVESHIRPPHHGRADRDTQRRHRVGATRPGEGQQRDQSHAGGSHHAWRRAHQDHKPDDHHYAENSRRARPRTAQPQPQYRNSNHQREIGSGHREKMTQPRSAEVIANLIIDRRRVAEDETWKQSGSLR